MNQKPITRLLLAASLPAVLLLLGMYGCNKRSDNTQTANAPSYESSTPAADSTSSSPTPNVSLAPVAPQSSVMQNGIDTSDLAILRRPKVVIKNGELSLKSENYELSMDRIRLATQHYGGYISHERVHTIYTNTIQADLTIKVPSAYFDTVLTLVKKMGDKVIDEDISAQEMTEQYEQSRTNLADTRAEIARLQAMLNSGNLTVKQRLDVEGKLRSLQEQASSNQASHNNLVRQVSYSTLTISLNADQKPGPFVRIWIAVAEGLDNFVDVLARLLAVTIAALPVLLLIALIVYLAIRYNRRQQQRLAAEAALRTSVQASPSNNPAGPV